MSFWVVVIFFGMSSSCCFGFYLDRGPTPSISDCRDFQQNVVLIFKFQCKRMSKLPLSYYNNKIEKKVILAHFPLNSGQILIRLQLESLDPKSTWTCPIFKTMCRRKMKWWLGGIVLKLRRVPVDLARLTRTCSWTSRFYRDSAKSCEMATTPTLKIIWVAWKMKTQTLDMIQALSLEIIQTLT